MVASISDKITIHFVSANLDHRASTKAIVNFICFFQAAIRPGLGAPQVAVIMRNLMLRLGYKQFFIQGGDWGALIGSNIATLFPKVSMTILNISFCHKTFTFLVSILLWRFLICSCEEEGSAGLLQAIIITVISRAAQWECKTVPAICARDLRGPPCFVINVQFKTDNLPFRKS